MSGFGSPCDTQDKSTPPAPHALSVQEQLLQKSPRNKRRSDQTGDCRAHAIKVKKKRDAPGEPAAVWTLVGRFCAIKDWHPAVANCETSKEDDVTFRTLTLKDGAKINSWMSLINSGLRFGEDTPELIVMFERMSARDSTVACARGHSYQRPFLPKGVRCIPPRGLYMLHV